MKLLRRPLQLGKPVVLALLVVGFACVPLEASAACSNSKVKRLSQQGKTVSSIAKSCDMDAEEVREILDQDEEDNEPAPNPGRIPEPRQDRGLSSGTPLAPCACWGYVAPGHRQPNQACRSGFAVPRMCPQVCPVGGYAWQGVCG
jgi:hypothetical protein